MATTNDNPEEVDTMRSTTVVSSAVRRALRRLDTWTLTAFNPRYPTPADRG